MKFRSKVDTIIGILIIVSILLMFFPTPELLTDPGTGEILIFSFYSFNHRVPDMDYLRYLLPHYSGFNILLHRPN